MICYFAPLFKPNIFMESLNSLIELWTFILGTTFTNLNAWHKIINTINSNIWCKCVGTGGWTNIWWWHVKLQIGNEIAPSTGGNLILNFSYSLRVDYKCNKVAPVCFEKWKIKVQRDSQFCWVRWVKINLVGNWGNELILIESHGNVPDFNEYFG